MKQSPGDANDSFERLRSGNRGPLATLFGEYHDHLRRMVELRLGPRLAAKRYFPALKRLKDLLAMGPGGWEGL